MNTAVARLPTEEPRPAGRSVLLSMATRYGMEPAAFEATLRATVVPATATREQFAAFLLVAKEYNLNPVLKEIYAFPTRGGGIQPIVSVDGWANLVNSHPECDGMDFEDRLDDDGQLVSITCRIYRKDRAHPVAATEYMAECRRATDTWRQWPRRMLRHKALIQAARYAFGFSGIADPDEAAREAAPTVSPVATVSNPVSAAALRQQAGIIDGEAREITTSGEPTPPAASGAPAASPATTPQAEQAPAGDPSGWSDWLSLRRREADSLADAGAIEAMRRDGDDLLATDGAPAEVLEQFAEICDAALKRVGGRGRR